MNTKITRREVLQFVGGSALGVLLSPLPWKVLDDTAIWTQNWPWTPKPTRGDITYRYTSCTLCQASCGMRSRTIGAQPVSLTGTRHHPFNNGALCTTGILAHHLRYHPARLKHPVKAAGKDAAHVTMTLAEAIAESGSALRQASSVAIIDERPGRAVSALYGEIALHQPNVRYVPVHARSIDALAVLSGNPSIEAGYDIEHARFILSFGAPLFDGWGSPALTANFLAKRGAQTLIQIEPVRSRTAHLAGEWIASRPGSDAAAALSMASVLIEENRASASALHAITDSKELAEFLKAYAPDRTASATGIDPRILRRTALRFAQEGPALALASNDAGSETRAAVMLLNILAGSVGVEGGIALRDEIPAVAAGSNTQIPASLDRIADHSVNVIVLDESLSGSTIPDSVLEKKLVENGGIIISLSPFAAPRPFALQYVIPSSVIFETLSDVPGPVDAPRASLALSTVLLPAPEGTLDAIQFAQSIGAAAGWTLSAAGSTEEIVKQRIASIHGSKRGTVFSASSGESQDVKQLASADDLWSALSDGGCWIDSPSASRAKQTVFSVMPAIRNVAPIAPHQSQPLIVYPAVSMNSYANTSVSPLMSKVSQESGLRLSSAQASVNPATAAAYDIRHGETISLRTKNGSLNVQAQVDAGVMPNVIFVSCSPDACQGALHTTNDVRMICEVSTSGSYSPTPVTIQKVYL